MFCLFFHTSSRCAVFLISSSILLCTRGLHGAKSVKAIGMSMQGYEMAAVEDESSDKNHEPEIDPFEYTRQVRGGG